MIPKECKRLAEVDFPIAAVSKNSVAEKEARCGHIPKIHIWPAARPLGACRSMLLALLLPDPCDRLCPVNFLTEARKLLSGISGTIGEGTTQLRKALIEFIVHFSKWELAASPSFLQVARSLIRLVNETDSPLLADPFAGGGAIPLEALRLDCESYASDLNPLSCLIQKVVLEDVPRNGSALIEQLRHLSERIKQQAEKELREFYPSDTDGAVPITYLWARTILCESPNCGAEIPLLRSLWLIKKPNRKRALRYRVIGHSGKPPVVQFEIFEPRKDSDVPPGTVTRAKATCLCCNIVLPPERVRAQLSAQRGGGDVIFDSKGLRKGGALLLAVVTLRPGEQGRNYRLSTDRDYEAVWKAQKVVRKLETQKLPNGMSAIPDEPTPAGGGSGAGRAFSVQKYGMLQWGDLFTGRQKVAINAFVVLLRSMNKTNPAIRLTALCLSKMIDMNNNLATWQPHAEIPAHMLTRFALPMKWDFAEAVPISDSSGTIESASKRSIEALTNLLVVERAGLVTQLDARATQLPDQSVNVWFTDPPYYDAVPYSDISDFFFVWLCRAIASSMTQGAVSDSSSSLSPKEREIVQDETRSFEGRRKDRSFFEEAMGQAFAEGRRVLKEDGIGCVVFAHKTTEGWEALLSGMIKGGWTITSSWPIATEMGTRLRARESAALATSVHLICRPRSEDAGIGDWGEVLHELPKRVGNWMQHLESEGIRGADLVFACIGPALEIYSRYSRVETPEGREVKLDEYLQKVWEVVGRLALEQILKTAEGAFEEDARLTALFLWTLQSTNGERATSEGEEEEDESDDDDEEESSASKSKGFSLIYDVVRRFAQPLGIHLPVWEGRIIETKKGVVSLIPVRQRMKQLFGEDGTETVAEVLERDPQKDLQPLLFPELEQQIGSKSKTRGKARKGRIEISGDSFDSMQSVTTLDRVHAAMLLQAAGRTNALRGLLKAEQDRGPDFMRLANALSPLYPEGSEEKRLLNAMVLAAPR